MKMNPEFEFNYGINLMPDLNRTYLPRLFELGQMVMFKRGGHLYYQGDQAHNLYALKAGTLKGIRSDINGHQTFLRIGGPGSLFGIEALRNTAKRDASVLALEEVETACFHRGEQFDYVKEDGELGILLIQMLVRRIQLLHGRVGDLAGHSVEQRLASGLLQLYTETKARILRVNDIIIAITHEELATLVLSRRQYVTMILRKFVLAKLIANKRGQIQILDPEGLVRLAG